MRSYVDCMLGVIATLCVVAGEQEKKDVMQGDLSGEHSLKSKVIRIFVCSTFTG